MKSHIKFAILIIYGLFLFSCGPKKEKKAITIDSIETYLVIADTIITDVVIKNPTDDEWTDYTIRNLNRKELVDQIFKAVYKKELVPYDFFNDTPLSVDKVREIESDPEFSRDKIAKVQFEEKWYYNAENNSMIKKVHSIMLAYEVYNAEGEIKGYKPTFKVYLK